MTTSVPMWRFHTTRRSSMCINGKGSVTEVDIISTTLYNDICTTGGLTPRDDWSVTEVDIISTTLYNDICTTGGLTPRDDCLSAITARAWPPSVDVARQGSQPNQTKQESRLATLVPFNLDQRQYSQTITIFHIETADCEADTPTNDLSPQSDILHATPPTAPTPVTVYFTRKTMRSFRCPPKRCQQEVHAAQLRRHCHH
ncbi:hypothetical protein J6590_039959 [Homalodisca vitripennis]|nr:hypothetical protein J6590_039959 [Homalodisca vitripennis]